MMNPRTMPRWARERPVTRYCQQPECGAATRQGKPYCSAHVEAHPYIRDLLGRIEGKEAEEARVRERGAGAVDPQGLTAQEILRFLIVHGERTVPRLARDLNVDLVTLRSYVAVLVAAGRIQTRPNRRGSSVLTYVEPDPVPAAPEAEAPAPQAKRRRRSSHEPASPGSAPTAV
jgi:hypothetical protein